MNGRISTVRLQPERVAPAASPPRGLPPVPIMAIRSGSRSLSSPAASTSRSCRFCGAAKRVATRMSSPGPALGPSQPAGTCADGDADVGDEGSRAARAGMPDLGGLGLDQRARGSPRGS